MREKNGTPTWPTVPLSKSTDQIVRTVKISVENITDYWYLMKLHVSQIIEDAKQLDLSQLERLHGWVQELIHEKREVLEDRRIASTKRELRGLLEKAGLSWEEFQDAL